MIRTLLSDKTWKKIEPILPGKQGDRGRTAKMLDTVEETLDQVACAVQRSTVAALCLAIRARWNDSLRPSGSNLIHEGELDMTSSLTAIPCSRVPCLLVWATRKCEHGLVKSRTVQVNQLRGLLYEFGVALKAGRVVGLGEVRERLHEIEQLVPVTLFGALRD